MLSGLQLNLRAQCPGGASWLNTPVNGTLIDSARIQVLDTVNVRSTNPTAGSFAAGRPAYNSNVTTWDGNPYESISVIRGGGAFASTSFKLRTAVDSNIMHFWIRDIRGDGLNAETQRIFGFNNGVPVTATAKDLLNGASFTGGNQINGGGSTTSAVQSSVRIFFNGPVDSVIIRGTSFNDYVIMDLVARCEVILPVNHIDLTGKTIPTGVQLNWKITGEADRIEIERSGDNNKWTVLSSTSGITNVFFDTDPLQETNYYRIKTIDISGTVKYSNVIPIRRTRGNNLPTVIYPNPFKNIITCESGVKIISYKLYSSTGSLVLSKEIIGTNNFTENLPSSLTKGLYHLILLFKNGEQRSYKLVKDY